ncbi:uncharacterized protein TNCV_502501 [Trichonephila clavipes]|nr:uncharacterized protein TNCV_502501 [Trichonephila clavipes]
MNLTWRNPPAQHWYAAKSPGLSLQSRSSRAHETALARLRSGHLRRMTFCAGGKVFLYLSLFIFWTAGAFPWDSCLKITTCHWCPSYALNSLFDASGAVIVGSLCPTCFSYLNCYLLEAQTAMNYQFLSTLSNDDIF